MMDGKCDGKGVCNTITRECECEGDDTHEYCTINHNCKNDGECGDGYCHENGDCICNFGYFGNKC